jgi:RNA polymerase sigma-70 factor, ECF subfamily
MKPSSSRQHDGETTEFVRLLAEHDRQLSAYIHTLIPSWPDAEDVVQNTKLRLWEQFDSFRRDGDFGAWAIAVANFMVRSHRRDSRRERVRFNDELLDKISRHIPAVASSKDDDRMPALLECVKTLGEAGQKLLRSFCAKRQKIKDLADELGQSPSAVYSALFRVRWSLFDCVQKRLKEERGP